MRTPPFDFCVDLVNATCAGLWHIAASVAFLRGLLSELGADWRLALLLVAKPPILAIKRDKRLLRSVSKYNCSLAECTTLKINLVLNIHVLVATLLLLAPKWRFI